MEGFGVTRVKCSSGVGGGNMKAMSGQFLMRRPCSLYLLNFFTTTHPIHPLYFGNTKIRYNFIT